MCPYYTLLCRLTENVFCLKIKMRHFETDAWNSKGLPLITIRFRGRKYCLYKVLLLCLWTASISPGFTGGPPYDHLFTSPRFSLRVYNNIMNANRNLILGNGGLYPYPQSMVAVKHIEPPAFRCRRLHILLCTPKKGGLTIFIQQEFLLRASRLPRCCEDDAHLYPCGRHGRDARLFQDGDDAHALRNPRASPAGHGDST